MNSQFTLQTFLILKLVRLTQLVDQEKFLGDEQVSISIYDGYR